MSLSTRAIAGLGAVVVIGAATVGVSVAHASSKGKPAENVATLTVGRSSITSAPFCYNDGKALANAAIAKCQADAVAAFKAGTLPKSDVRASDRIGVGVPTGTAERGWFAYTDAGAQGQTPLVQNAKGTTWSGSLAAPAVLNSTGKTQVTVVEADQKTSEIISVWYFDLTTKD